MTLESPTEFALRSGVANDETVILAKEKLRKCYEDIMTSIDTYLDIPNDHKVILTLWIIGTYFHKTYATYPFLFINAMRGSGKTRTLKLIESMCWRGKVTNNITEAVLFRTAATSTILIDEFERPGAKEKNVLRELLNSAYKKGSTVERMRKQTNRDGEMHIVEKFELYTPIVLANIWGIEEVLGDRCITLILEKSTDLQKTRLIEDFDQNPMIKAVKEDLNMISVVWCSVVTDKYIEQWNKYINNKYTIYTTTHTNNYTKLHTKEILENEFYNKVDATMLNGRDLELFFPLFLIAKELDGFILDEILTIAKLKVLEKKEDEFVESKDVCLIDFVSQKSIMGEKFESMTALAKQFKEFYVDDDEEQRWLNSKWMGRALKRLGLIRDKKRVFSGIQVILDVAKAQERIKMYRSKDDAIPKE